MKLLQKPLVRYGIVAIVSMAIGAIFYPSKKITIEEKMRLEREISKLEQEKRDIEKDYQDKLTKQEHVYREYKSQSESKISSLKEENTNLKQKVKERTLKIVKPDGTVVEETYRESETEIVSKIITEIRKEFNEKVESIETKWKKIHEERVTKIKENYERQLSEKDKKIEQYEKKKTIEVNARKFGVSFGVMTKDQYFSSIQYDIFGPMFLDIHLGGDFVNETRTGIGLGIRF